MKKKKIQMQKTKHASYFSKPLICTSAEPTDFSLYSWNNKPGADRCLEVNKTEQQLTSCCLTPPNQVTKDLVKPDRTKTKRDVFS